MTLKQKLFKRKSGKWNKIQSGTFFKKEGGGEFLLLRPSAFGEFEIYSTLKAPKSILYCKKLEMFSRTFLNLLPSPLNILKSLGQSWTRLCTPARRGGHLYWAVTAPGEQVNQSSDPFWSLLICLEAENKQPPPTNLILCLDSLPITLSFSKRNTFIV